VSTSKNLWNCFSECKSGGNALDFIAKMEAMTIHAAALKAIDWFGLDSETMTANSKEVKTERNESPAKERDSKRKAPSKPAVAVPDKDTPNKPLGFHLEKLDQTHPYLAERGLTPETIAEFGLGYCAKGMMANRIAIPIHNLEGKVVAYAGRIPGEPAGDMAKYKLPQGFRKSLELFNIHRAMQEPAESVLVIVEGFFDCLKLYQCGCRKVVALMGSTMSTAQEELVRIQANGQSRIIVMLDEDEAGRAAREDIAVRLAKMAFVKIHSFPKEGMQPDELRTEDLGEIIGGEA
jgi:DNA primase